MESMKDDVIVREHTIVTEISAIVEFAESRLDSIHSMVPTIEQAKIGFQGLEKIKSIIAELSTILDRGVNALKDEEALLLARLNEIKKVKSSIAPVKSTQSEKQCTTRVRCWGDESDDEVISALSVHDRDSGRPGDRDSGRPGDRDSGRPGDRDSGREQFDDGFHKPRYNRGNHKYASDRPRDRDNNKPKKEYKMGDRIPKESPYPLMFERRATLDDIRGFQIVITPDRNYGQMISFTFGESVTKIGGVIDVVPEISGRRPLTCEQLLYNGNCRCTGVSKLPPHAGHPLELPISGLVGILHKFLINYNGNKFRPGEQSTVHIDAVLLRCVVYAIVQLLGVKKVNTPIEINLGLFSDVVEPKNINASMENYYRNRGDENPKSVARGLWVATATHFVSS